VFLSGADSQEAQRLARSIQEKIGAQSLILGNEKTLTIEVTVTPVSFPRDGGSLSDLIAVARSRIGSSVSADHSIH
jgi:hypothetical protein